MSGQEIRRWVILIALVFVGMMLVQAWNAGQQVASQLPSTISPNTNLPDDAAAVPTPAVGGGDVPLVPANPSVSPASPSQPIPDDLISISTDVLKLSIDPLGGDVVEAQLLRYPLEMTANSAPIALLTRSNGHLYVAQSGLVGVNGPDGRAEARPLYRSQSSQYSLSDDADRLTVVMDHVDAAGVHYKKTFVLTRGEYRIEINTQIDNRSGAPWQGNWFAQLKRDGYVPPSPGGALAPQPFIGAAFSTPDEPFGKYSFDDLVEVPFAATVQGGWAAIMQHYFIAAWVPSPDAPHSLYGNPIRANEYRVGFTGPTLQVAPGTKANVGSVLYVGPKVQSSLAATAPHLELTVDYGWLWFLASGMFWVMNLMHQYVGNWGVAIILLTLIVKLALYPLSAASYRSMAKMRDVAPEMRRIQERYSDDRTKMQQEMMELYKRAQVNPLGGCLPMLAQMPVFLALYWVLYESVELRQAPFLLWIHDLSVMDPYFVLPLLMGVTMYVQQALSPPVPDPMQARMMKIMPAVFTVLFVVFPAGLVLYWLVNNVLSIAQQWWVTKQHEMAKV